MQSLFQRLKKQLFSPLKIPILLLGISKPISHLLFEDKALGAPVKPTVYLEGRGMPRNGTGNVWGGSRQMFTLPHPSLFSPL